MALNDDQMTRAAAYLEAANNLLAQRFNYALVAHSMALTAYATCSGNNVDALVQIAVCIFGFVYALIQWQITSPLTKRIDALREATVVDDPIYQHYKTAAGGTRIRGLQSVVVPFGLAALWGTLLLHAVHVV